MSKDCYEDENDNDKYIQVFEIDQVPDWIRDGSAQLVGIQIARYEVITEKMLE